MNNATSTTEHTTIDVSNSQTYSATAAPHVSHVASGEEATNELKAVVVPKAGKLSLISIQSAC